MRNKYIVFEMFKNDIPFGKAKHAFNYKLFSTPDKAYQEMFKRIPEGSFKRTGPNDVGDRIIYMWDNVQLNIAIARGDISIDPEPYFIKNGALTHNGLREFAAFEENNEIINCLN
jgi:hypothetical protein